MALYYLEYISVLFPKDKISLVLHRVNISYAKENFSAISCRYRQILLYLPLFWRVCLADKEVKHEIYLS